MSKKNLRVTWTQDGLKRELYQQTDTSQYSVQIDDYGNLLVVRDGEERHGSLIVSNAQQVEIILAAATRWSVEYV